MSKRRSERYSDVIPIIPTEFKKFKIENEKTEKDCLQNESISYVCEDLSSEWTPENKEKEIKEWKPIKLKLKKEKVSGNITESQNHYEFKTQNENTSVQEANYTTQRNSKNENHHINIKKHETIKRPECGEHSNFDPKPELTYKYRENAESNYLYKTSGRTSTHDNADNCSVLNNKTSSFNNNTCRNEQKTDTDSDEQLRQRIKKLNRKYNILKQEHSWKKERTQNEKLMSESDDSDDEILLSKRRSRKKKTKKSKRRSKLIKVVVINYYPKQKYSEQTRHSSDSEGNDTSLCQAPNLPVTVKNNVLNRGDNSLSSHEKPPSTYSKSNKKHSLNPIVNVDELKSILLEGSLENLQDQLRNASTSDHSFDDLKISSVKIKNKNEIKPGSTDTNSDEKCTFNSISNVNELETTSMHESVENVQDQLKNALTSDQFFDLKISTEIKNVDKEINSSNEHLEFKNIYEDNKNKSPIVISDNDSENNNMLIEKSENVYGEETYTLTIEQKLSELFGDDDSDNFQMNIIGTGENSTDKFDNYNFNTLVNILKTDTSNSSEDAFRKLDTSTNSSVETLTLGAEKQTLKQQDQDECSETNNHSKRENNSEIHTLKEDSVVNPPDKSNSCSIPFLESEEEKQNGDKAERKAGPATPPPNPVETKRKSKVHKRRIRSPSFSSPRHDKIKRDSPFKHKEHMKKEKRLSNLTRDKIIKTDIVENCEFAKTLENKMSVYLRGTFKMQSCIRNGRYSDIYFLRERNSDQKYAIKIAKSRRTFSKNMLIKNKQPLKGTNYEYGVEVIEILKTFCLNKQWCSVMEYYPVNLLQQLIRRKKSFHIDHIQILAKQLISALTFLRRYNIVHSDINPRHVLLYDCDQKLKLCGFDEAFSSQSVHLKPNIGSVGYRAPEVILGYQKADSNIDIWSVALVLFEMATKCQLFQSNTNNDTLYKMLRILGNIPSDMLGKCLYTSCHFRGKMFIKLLGRDDKCFYTNFKKTQIIVEKIDEIYKEDWKQTRSVQEQIQDAIKLKTFQDMIEKMLDWHPTRRLRIEFIPKNPFISN